jgi:hypothetical protein
VGKKMKGKRRFSGAEELQVGDEEFGRLKEIDETVVRKA